MILEKKPVHDKCIGCDKVQEDSTCAAYPNPEIWWNRGSCPLATHLEKKTKDTEKVRIGQQKQKRKGR
jgi:hypothetical protein